MTEEEKKAAAEKLALEEGKEPIEEEEEEEESDSEGEKEPENPDKKDEVDLDEEIEKEKKRGKPDPEKAKEAFKDRKEKAKDEDHEEDDNKPLTRKDLSAVRAEVRQELLSERALEIAKSLTGSAKEAELTLLRWKNRSFPSDLSLSEQLEEVYAGMRSKKIIGERDEALRALKGREGASKTASTSYRDAPTGNEPKIKPQDAAAFKAAGYAWNATNRRYEKKLSNGDLLVRDSVTKKTIHIRKSN